jgi:hypothetical protein
MTAKFDISEILKRAACGEHVSPGEFAVASLEWEKASRSSTKESGKFVELVQRVYDIDVSTFIGYETPMRMEVLLQRTGAIEIKWNVSPGRVRATYPGTMSDKDIREAIQRAFVQ